MSEMADAPYALHAGDCLELMAGMEAESVDAVVTDPPYDLLSGSRGGFLGLHWDGTGVAFRPETWAGALRVLRPSCYLLTFGGTRTWHRLACALEDAGFEIRDTLMWLYGQGFPKGRACLKPAWEPVILARKPGPIKELGIEECRTGPGHDGGNGRDGQASASRRYTHRGGTNFAVTPGPRGGSPAGRWPANVVLDEASAGLLDRQTGTASRFFFCAKASRAERNAGCEGMEEREPAWNKRGWAGSASGVSHGSVCARRANYHPTVKPLSLMHWLVRLVARPGDLVLDPFMGSGTTGVACIKTGRRFVGIELDPEYAAIAECRIAAAAAQARLEV